MIKKILFLAVFIMLATVSQGLYAQAAIPRAMKSEVCGAFFSLMEGMEEIADVEDPSEGVVSL